MARRTRIVTMDHVADGDRDKGKHYLITEMPARQAEKWAAKAILALSHTGVEIPEELQGAGMAAVAVYGIKTIVRVEFDEAEPLMDEMMACVQAIPDPRSPQVIRALVDSDIEEVSTLWHLRMEVFELHTGFSLADFLSNLRSASTRTESNSNDTSTSQPS